MNYYVKFQVKTTSCTQARRLSGPAPQTARAAAALIFLVWNEPDTDSNQGPIVPTMTLISALAPPLPARRVADPKLPESCPPRTRNACNSRTSVCFLTRATCQNVRQNLIPRATAYRASVKVVELKMVTGTGELTGFSPRIDRISPSSISKRYSKG